MEQVRQDAERKGIEGQRASLETPVVLIVFNRPAQTRRVFERVAAERPKRLLIIADGPRPNRSEEGTRCAEVLDIVSEVDWPCHVSTNVSEKNLGCRARVTSGLTWAFSEVEEAIILEDDVLPDPSFFPFCGEMLSRYREEPRVGMITGFNIGADVVQSRSDYYFSALTHIWGWASWRRAWRSYDGAMRCWPEVRHTAAYRGLFSQRTARRYWRHVLNQVFQGQGPNTWDYQWMLTNIVQDRLVITPRVNLVENIGFGADATHVTDVEGAPTVSVGSLQFPLRHPHEIQVSRDLDELDQQLSGWHRASFPIRAKRKLQQRMCGSGGLAA